MLRVRPDQKNIYVFLLRQNMVKMSIKDGFRGGKGKKVKPGQVCVCVCDVSLDASAVPTWFCCLKWGGELHRGSLK